MTSNRMLLFRRQEIKYMIDRTTRTALARDLAAFMRPDAHAGEGGYLVRSLYFDTPEYMAYHEKLAGMAVRHKLRIRAYGDDPSQAALIRLEVKSRHLSFINKIAVDIARADYGPVAHALQRRILPPAGLMNDNKVSKEFFRLQRQYNMEPKVIVQYRRQAFERREGSRVRVSFDSELIATRNLDLLGPLAGGRRLLRPDHSIFEIKLDDFMPYWMHTLIAKYDLQNQAISKYCYAVRSEARFSAIGRPEE
jgi:hypothetical protein